MMKKLQKFMKGRYGFDELNYLLFNIYIIIFAANIFIESQIIDAICLLIVFITIYRALSKNIYTRNNENRKYKKILVKISKPFRSDIYVYRKCKRCKSTLRFTTPSKIGIKHSKCPECNYKNTYLILKRRKNV